MKKYQQYGFTMAELMATLVILGVLSAIMIPLYQNHIEKTRLATAKAALQEKAMSVAKIYIRDGSYTQVSTATEKARLASSDDYYDYSVVSSDGTSFMLKALPRGNNNVDKTLFIDQQSVLNVCDGRSVTTPSTSCKKG